MAARCRFCPLEFATVEELEQHARSHVSTPPAPGGRRRYTSPTLRGPLSAAELDELEQRTGAKTRDDLAVLRERTTPAGGFNVRSLDLPPARIEIGCLCFKDGLRAILSVEEARELVDELERELEHYKEQRA